jgi:hypothetical protein
MVHDPRSDPGSGSGHRRYPGSFLLVFRQAAADLSWEVRRWRGHLVECVDEQGNTHTVGLENLYRMARREPRESWLALIGDFLKTASAVGMENDLPTDLAAVADQLLVRLGPPLQPATAKTGVWEQTLSESGLSLNLVVDYADRMCYVTEQLLTDSGRPGSEWLQRAMANLQAKTPADCLELVDEESGIRLCALGDAYDSSRALLLDLLLPEYVTDGFFAAIPGRDQLLVLPVALSALSFVPLLKMLAEKNFKSAPYPISDALYWIRAGVWRRFLVQVKDAEATIQPPEEFVEVLRRLVPEEELAELEEEIQQPEAEDGNTGA